MSSTLNDSNNKSASTSVKNAIRYVITIVSFILAAVIIVLTSIHIKQHSWGLIFVNYLLGFLLLMVGISELVTSDTILSTLSYHTGYTSVNSEDKGWRIIKNSQPEVELTPLQHYINITGQVSIVLIVIIAFMFCLWGYLKFKGF